MGQVSYAYRQVPGGLCLTGFSGEAPKQLTLPALIDGQPVLEIGSYAFFANGQELEEIRLPEGIRVVHDYAFAICIGLKRLVLSESVEYLGNAVLLGSRNVRHLHLPAAVRHMGTIEEWEGQISAAAENPVFVSDDLGLYERDGQEMTLRWISPHDRLSHYRILPGTTRVLKGAMTDNRHLTRLHLPASLVHVPDGALSNGGLAMETYTGLRRVTVDPDNPVLRVEGDFLLERRQGRDRLLKYFGSAEAVSVPEGVFEIAAQAFYKSPALRVSLPASLERICRGAFDLCYLQMLKTAEGLLTFPRADSSLYQPLIQAVESYSGAFDLSFFDALLAEKPMSAGMGALMIRRLSGRLGLTSAAQAAFKKRLKEEASDLFAALALEGDAASAEALLDLDILDSQEILAAIARLSQPDMDRVFAAADLRFALIARQQSRSLSEEEDFSL